MKTSGFKDHRLIQDDDYYAKEIKALEIFNKEYLSDADLIVFGQKDGTGCRPKDHLTEREEKIVLSVIQWLGTLVGQHFISSLDDK